MRHAVVLGLVGAAAALLAGCPKDPATHCGSVGCPAGQQCVSGLCVQGSGGGGGGGTGAGGGVPAACAGIQCAPDSECRDQGGTGVCVLRFERVVVVEPQDGGPYAPDAAVPLRANLLVKPGFAATGFPAALAFTGAGTGTLGQLGSGEYAGQGQAPLTSGAYTVTVSLPDAGLQDTGSYLVDATPPVFTVTLPAPQLRPGAIPDLYFPNLGTGWRKNQIAPIQVTSDDVDVDEATVTLTARVDPWAPTASYAPRPCTPPSAKPYCRVFDVDLARVEMKTNEAGVVMSAAGRDLRGNAAPAPATATLPLGFANWTRRLTFPVATPVRLTPAIGEGGRIFIHGDGLLLVLEPDGREAWSRAAPGESAQAGPAVAADDGGRELVFTQGVGVFGQTASRAFAADSGVQVGMDCTAAGGTSAYPPPLSNLAIIRSDAGVLAVGMAAGSSGQLAARAFSPSASPQLCTQGAGGVAGPVILAAIGSDFYAGAPGVCSAFSVDPLGGIVGGGLVNTIWGSGLAVLPGSSALVMAGMTGPAAYAAPTLTRLWWSTADSVVSGPVVTSAGVVVAVRTAAGPDGGLAGNRVQLVRYGFDGGEVARSAELEYQRPNEHVVSSVTGTVIPTPLAASGGVLYVADETGQVSVMRQNFADGEQVSFMSAGNGHPVSASPAIDCDRERPDSGLGVLYVVDETGQLRAWFVEARGLDPTAWWPKHLRDAWNTANSATSGLAPACP